MNDTALSVSGLTKRFGSRIAVDNLDLEVPSGVVAGFVGPNGAGKTTTMAMLLGLVRPTSGTARVLGHPIEKPAAYLGRVGALVESPAFYPALTGAQNLSMFASIADHDPGEVPGLLDQVGLGDRGDDRYRSYSLGMKQRLGIAAALLGDPELLILDEPTNGLDPQGVREMRSLISRLGASGRTTLVSSHDLSELEQVCDWLVLIDTGRSLYQGPTAALLEGTARTLALSTAQASETALLLNLLVARGERVDQHDKHLSVELNGQDFASSAAALNRAAFEAGIVLTEITPRRLSLEDRYLSLMDGGVSK